MRRVCKYTALSLLIILFCCNICYSAWVWTPETGRWINPRSAVKDTAQEQFKYAMDFYKSKDYKRAVSEFDKLVKVYPNSKPAPESQYYIGRAYGDIEEYYRAFLAYQKTIEAYPHAKNREEIIKREYDIGIKFFEGQKAKILGLSVLPATDKAIEIFEQVIKNSPYGEYADKSQFKIGESYKKSDRFGEAIMAFQKLVDDYPRSELVSEANYQIAHCGYLTSLGASYDQESTDTAIEKYEDFIAQTDENMLAEDVKDALNKLRQKKAEGIYETARFYDKIGQRQSASIYYKEVVDKYPNSPLAKKSLTRIMEIDNESSRATKR